VGPLMIFSLESDFCPISESLANPPKYEKYKVWRCLNYIGWLFYG